MTNIKEPSSRKGPKTVLVNIVPLGRKTRDIDKGPAISCHDVGIVEGCLRMQALKIVRTQYVPLATMETFSVTEEY